MEVSFVFPPSLGADNCSSPVQLLQKVIRPNLYAEPELLPLHNLFRNLCNLYAIIFGFFVLFASLRWGATSQQLPKKARIQNSVLYFFTWFWIQNDDGVKLVSGEGRLYSHCMNTLGPRCQPSGNYLHFIIMNNIVFQSNFLISFLYFPFTV